MVEAWWARAYMFLRGRHMVWYFTNRTGTRVGMILGFVSLANLTGPAVCGALIREQDGSYLGAQMFAGSSILLGAIMALAARIAETGLVLRIKI